RPWPFCSSATRKFLMAGASRPAQENSTFAGENVADRFIVSRAARGAGAVVNNVNARPEPPALQTTAFRLRSISRVPSILRQGTGRPEAGTHPCGRRERLDGP